MSLTYNPAGVLSLLASEPYTRAVLAISELLTKQRLTFAFVGGVARSAWLSFELRGGSVDVLAMMQPQQKNQVVMMATHRGFRVDRNEIEQSEELDLIPLHFGQGEPDIRLHVLVASNALYAKMIVAARPATLGELAILVPTPEDFALLASLAEDEETVLALTSRPDFDRALYNDKLLSIGLGGMILR